MNRMWRKINFQMEYCWLEFIVFLLLDRLPRQSILLWNYNGGRRIDGFIFFQGALARIEKEKARSRFELSSRSSFPRMITVTQSAISMMFMTIFWIVHTHTHTHTHLHNYTPNNIHKHAQSHTHTHTILYFNFF